MGRVVTPVFRVSFASVFKQRLNPLNQKMEYSLVAIFPAGADLTGLKKLAQEALLAKWPDKSKWPASLRNPFRKHEEKAKPDEKDPSKLIFPQGMEAGGIFLTLRNEKNKPEIIGPNKLEIIDEVDFYSGCYARASVNAYAYQHKSGNCGVNFGLGNLQKVKDGEPLGSRTRAQDDFEPVEGAQEAAATASASDLFA